MGWNTNQYNFCFQPPLMTSICPHTQSVVIILSKNDPSDSENAFKIWHDQPKQKSASCNHHLCTLFESPHLCICMYIYRYIEMFLVRYLFETFFLIIWSTSTWVHHLGVGEDDYCSQCGRGTWKNRGGGWNVVVGVSSSEPMEQPPLVGGSSLDLVQWVDIHGDRFCPQDLGLWDPFQMAL